MKKQNELRETAIINRIRKLEDEIVRSIENNNKYLQYTEDVFPAEVESALKQAGYKYRLNSAALPYAFIFYIEL